MVVSVVAVVMVANENTDNIASCASVYTRTRTSIENVACLLCKNKTQQSLKKIRI